MKEDVEAAGGLRGVETRVVQAESVSQAMTSVRISK